MVVWNRNCKIRFPGCFFVSPRWGKSKKRVLNKIIRPSVNPALCAAWKSPPKMVVWNRNYKIRFPWCFFVSPRLGKSKKRVLNKIIRPSVNPALCAAWKSPPKMVVWNRSYKIRFPGCFFVSPRWGKSKKRVLNKIIRPSVNPALCAAWKSPPKMVVWNRSCKIRFPWCFFVSCRWGKSKKRVLNKIIRPWSTRLYALLGKAHPKWGMKPKL